MEALPSLLKWAPKPMGPGERAEVTVDLATAAGSALLIHSEWEVVERDYAVLRRLQPTLFDCVEESEEIVACIEPPPTGTPRRRRRELSPG